MLELYMIRHGFAGTPVEDKAKDEARPLKPKGKDKTKEISKGLKEMDIRFDVVLSSPLLRAKQTAEIVNAYCGMHDGITITELLRPDASYQNLIKFLNKLKKADKIAIVGHEPFLGGFASFCLAKTNNSFINLKKNGVLMLQINEVIKPKRCSLGWVMEPRQLIG